MTVHHEESDINLRGVLGFGLGLFVVAVVVHLVIWGMFSYFNAREARHVEPEYPLAITQAAKTPPEPRLQVNPRQDLRDLRDQEDRILGSYGWADKNAGTVRIPIDEAIRLTLQRGLPARQENGR
ncbi:MAG: hypothetical protein LAO77_01845 [Acidobacteriia bacterium]|nr:hypothetical protein [Terriglobia bacterium]